jgi:hypothetical protein
LDAWPTVRELIALYPAFAEEGREVYRKWLPDTAMRELTFLGLEKAGLKVRGESVGESAPAASQRATEDPPR